MFIYFKLYLMCIPCNSVSKEFACNSGDPGLIPRLGRSPGEGNGNHSTILAWTIPWREEPGGLQSVGSQELEATEQLSTNKHVYFFFLMILLLTDQLLTLMEFLLEGFCCVQPALVPIQAQTFNTRRVLSK